MICQRPLIPRRNLSIFHDLRRSADHRDCRVRSILARDLVDEVYDFRGTGPIGTDNDIRHCDIRHNQRRDQVRPDKCAVHAVRHTTHRRISIPTQFPSHLQTPRKLWIMPSSTLAVSILPPPLCFLIPGHSEPLHRTPFFLVVTNKH